MFPSHSQPALPWHHTKATAPQMREASDLLVHELSGMFSARLESVVLPG